MSKTEPLTEMLWLGARVQPTLHKEAACLVFLCYSGPECYKVKNFDSDL